MKIIGFLFLFLLLNGGMFAQSAIISEMFNAKNLTSFRVQLKETVNLNLGLRSIPIIEEKEEFSDQTYISIPKAYCYDDLALFCKLEVQLDKAFKMPIRIRLGNLAYVNYLEGK
jgi:hypothetical protein